MPSACTEGQRKRMWLRLPRGRCRSLSPVRLSAAWIAGRRASTSPSASQSLLRLMSVESVMPSNHLFCLPAFNLLPLPSVFPSIRIFSNQSALHTRWPTYWSFSISPSNKYSGLISFRIDWFDLLAVQGTLKSLLSITVQKHQIFRAQVDYEKNRGLRQNPKEMPLKDKFEKMPSKRRRQ